MVKKVSDDQKLSYPSCSVKEEKLAISNGLMIIYVLSNIKTNTQHDEIIGYKIGLSLLFQLPTRFY